jgi:hypothetical protein
MCPGTQGSQLDDGLGDGRHRREHVTLCRLGGRARPDGVAVGIALVERLYSSIIDIGDDDLFDWSDRRDGFELCVRLGARPDDPQRPCFGHRQLVGRDRRRGAGPEPGQCRPVHDRKRAAGRGIGVDHRPDDRRQCPAGGVVGVDVHPLDPGCIPVLGPQIGWHRPEIAIVRRQVDVGLGRHLCLATGVGGERGLDRRHEPVHVGVSRHRFVIQQS